jgi:hypothetical protein
MIFWDLTPCNPVDMFKTSGGICCLYRQCTVSCPDSGGSRFLRNVGSPIAQYSFLHCQCSETPSNIRCTSLLKRVFQKKSKINCTALNVYHAFSQTAFSYRKIMFLGLSKSEKLYLEFDTHHNFYFGKIRKSVRFKFEVI